MIINLYMNNSNPAREVQTYVCEYLNEQLSGLSVDFLAEDRKDIEFQIKNNLQKVGIATTVMTPTMNYIGKTDKGQAWEIPDFTIQTVEYVPVNRASNKAKWASGFDICFAAQQVMAGPDAECGFGKFNPVRIEQGEDNGLLVNKAVFKCYFVDEPPKPERSKTWPFDIEKWTDVYNGYEYVRDDSIQKWVNVEHDRMVKGMYDTQSNVWSFDLTYISQPWEVIYGWGESKSEFTDRRMIPTP